MNETFGYCTSLCKQNKTEVIGCILVVTHHKGVNQTGYFSTSAGK